MFLEIFSQLKRERDINDRQFAIASNIPYSTVRGWTYQKKLPDIEGLVKIADYFEVSTDYLLGRSNDVGVIETNANLTAFQNKLLAVVAALPRDDQFQVLGFAQALAR